MPMVVEILKSVHLPLVAVLMLMVPSFLMAQPVESVVLVVLPLGQQRVQLKPKPFVFGVAVVQSILVELKQTFTAKLAG
jgi:hypothetical protein